MSNTLCFMKYLIATLWYIYNLKTKCDKKQVGYQCYTLAASELRLNLDLLPFFSTFISSVGSKKSRAAIKPPPPPKAKGYYCRLRSYNKRMFFFF